MPKTKVVIDYETRSNIDLLRMGRTRYMHDPSTEILMLGYRYVSPSSVSKVWLPGDPHPDFIKNPQDYNIYAHNAEFEQGITKHVGAKRYGFKPTEIDNYTCLMALCGRYGLPQALDQAGKALNLTQQKNPEGNLLIKLFCTPDQNFGLGPDGSIATHNLYKWDRFIQYCHDDVNTEYELLHTLPADHLSPDERETWLLSCLMNARGIPVDITAIRQIRRVAEQYRIGQFDLLPELTNNKITKITQTARIVKFVKDLGISMENCQAATVSEMLERDDLPDVVVELLEMRAAIGMSSVGKYIRFEEMSRNGRIYDNMRYYGAHTGRWTGSGVQLLNLPRATISDKEAHARFKAGSISEDQLNKANIRAVENEIEKYFTGDIADENPVKSARALIRPMLRASPGNVFIAADYSSIEYIVLEWLAGATENVERFKQGFDQYIDQAAFMYDIKPEFVNSSQRQDGKVVVLGCGFGQGARKLQITAKQQWGMDLTFEQSQFLVNGYRKKHADVVRMWYKLKDAALLAIQQPGVPYTVYKTTFKVVRDRAKALWLMMTLPSGRSMYYREPIVIEDQYGLVPAHMGLNQTTKVWGPMKLIPGRITENIVQASSRDILVHGMKKAEAAGLPIMWTIYDEVVCEVPEDKAEESLALLYKCMCSTESWSRDIPLRADGYYGPRYKKG